MKYYRIETLRKDNQYRETAIYEAENIKVADNNRTVYCIHNSKDDRYNWKYTYRTPVRVTEIDKETYYKSVGHVWE